MSKLPFLPPSFQDSFFCRKLVSIQLVAVYLIYLTSTSPCLRYPSVGPRRERKECMSSCGRRKDAVVEFGTRMMRLRKDGCFAETNRLRECYCKILLFVGIPHIRVCCCLKPPAHHHHHHDTSAREVRHARMQNKTTIKIKEAPATVP